MDKKQRQNEGMEKDKSKGNKKSNKKGGNNKKDEIQKRQ
jgi:hypothetical protein